MAKNCGACQLFQGPNKKCGVGINTSAAASARIGCFKGPASLFSNKVCGGCRLFQGPNQKCGGGLNTSSTALARSGCYSPIPG